MGTDSIGGPNTLGRLSSVSPKGMERSFKDRDPDQQFFQNSKKEEDFTKFDFTEAEFRAVLAEFEKLEFFINNKFKIKLEKEFPETIIIICDTHEVVLKKLTVPQFIATVKSEKEKQESGTKTGHLINRKA